MTPEDFMRQAGMTAHDYMDDAVRRIDGKFGDDYARNNPVLVAAFMLTCAFDFHTSINKHGR